jgi:hypothetical protein
MRAELLRVCPSGMRGQAGIVLHRALKLGLHMWSAKA